MLVGISEAELTRRLGQPDEQSGDVAQRFLTYDNVDARYIRTLAGYHYDYGYFTGVGPPPARAEFRCRTTFVVADGRVRAYDLRGNGCR